MSQTLGETMMASFMASTKEIPDIFILVVVEGLTPLRGVGYRRLQPEHGGHVIVVHPPLGHLRLACPGLRGIR